MDAARDRLGRFVYEQRVRGLGSDWDEPWFAESIKESWRVEADRFLAAGFGSMADAWDDGYVTGFNDDMFTEFHNPHRLGDAA